MTEPVEGREGQDQSHSGNGELQRERRSFPQSGERNQKDEVKHLPG
jgi:hypothetical protein